MMLPSWFWRVWRSKRFRQAMTWFPALMIVFLALAYLGVDWNGKKAWEETVEELNKKGYPSTIEEAVGNSAERGPDIFEMQAVRDEIDRFELDNDPLGGLSLLQLKDKDKSADLDFDWGPDGPDFTVFFKEKISNKDAAQKILESLMAYESRRKEMVAVRPGRWVLGMVSGDDSGFAFLSLTSSFLTDHALVAITTGRSDLVVEDLQALIAWSHAIDQTPQTGFGYMLGGMLQSSISTIVEQGLMAGVFDESQLGDLLESMSRYDFQNGYRNALAIEVSGWIEGYDEVMKDRPKIDWDMWWANWTMDWELIQRKAMSLFYAFGPEGIHARSLAEALNRAGMEAAKTDDIALEDFLRFRDLNLAKPTFPELELEEFALAPPLSESVWEFLEMSARSCLSGEASLRITREAMKLERHRLKEGGFPESLEIGDPFSKASLGYRPEKDGGYSIWSVGPDGVDDGGTGDDLVFRYWVRGR